MMAVSTALAEMMLRAVCPQGDADAILGDIEEIVDAPSGERAAGRYLLEVLRAIPALSLRHIELKLAGVTPGHAGLLVLSLAFVLLWENRVAHMFAWPLSQATGEFLGLGSLHACRWSYIFLSVLGLVVWLLSLRLGAYCWPVLRTSLRRAPVLAVLCGCGLAVYFMIRPDPSDGFLHRCFHILAILGAGAVMCSVYRFDASPSGKA